MNQVIEERNKYIDLQRVEIEQLTKERDELKRIESSITIEVNALEDQRDSLLATKHHMDLCRALLKVPSDEVLGVAIEKLQKENDDLKAKYSQITATNLNNVGDYEMQAANLRTELERETKWSREYFEKLERAEERAEGRVKQLGECCRKEFSDAQKWSDEWQKLSTQLLTAQKLTTQRMIEAEELTARLETAEAKCAEMRGVIDRIAGFNWSDPLAERIEHALSTDCGKGLLDKMETMRCELVKSKCAEVKAILLEERVKRLEEALKKYGKHSWNCNPSGDPIGECTCGFEQAISETGGEK